MISIVLEETKIKIKNVEMPIYYEKLHRAKRSLK
jgi:hypothetical protein